MGYDKNKEIILKGGVVFGGEEERGQAPAIGTKTREEEEGGREGDYGGHNPPIYY